MRVYHTFEAAAILAGGFQDGTGYYLTDQLSIGVWLSNKVLDINEGAARDTVLSIDIPAEVLSKYEWVEEGKPYREFQVPASVVNRHGRPRIWQRL